VPLVVVLWPKQPTRLGLDHQLQHQAADGVLPAFGVRQVVAILSLEECVIGHVHRVDVGGDVSPHAELASRDGVVDGVVVYDHVGVAFANDDGEHG